MQHVLILALVTVVTSLGSCVDDSPDPPPAAVETPDSPRISPTGKADQVSSDPRFVCDRPEDCRVISRACCDACADRLAVNRWYAGELGVEEDECETADCQEICLDTQLLCIEGQCAFLELEEGPPCETLSELQCAMDRKCEPLYAIVPLTMTCRAPNLPPTFVGCRDMYQCRSETFDCAINPDTGAISWFLGQCPPQHWAECPDVCETLCEGRREESCEADSECVALYGDRAGTQCGEESYVGCAAPQPCDPSPRCATDPLGGGTVWFADSCVPRGWDPARCNATCQ